MCSAITEDNKNRTDVSPKTQKNNKHLLESIILQISSNSFNLSNTLKSIIGTKAGCHFMHAGNDLVFFFLKRLNIELERLLTTKRVFFRLYAGAWLRN